MRKEKGKLRQNENSLKDICIAIFLLVVFLLSIVFLSSAAIQFWAPRHDIFVERIAIVTLKDQSKLSGSFGLFGGIINEEPVYYYYAARGDGYELRSIPADRSIIIEHDGAPHIDIYTPELDAVYARWQVFHVARINPEIDYRYYVYVPHGAIVREFVLDAEL